LKSFCALVRVCFVLQDPNETLPQPSTLVNLGAIMKNILKPIFIATTLFASTAIIAQNASAAPQQADRKAKFQKLDADGDGKISRAEAASNQGLAKYFDQIDTNHDGFLTPAELQAQRAKRAAAKLKAVDKDGDGRISRAEAEAKAPHLAKNFDRLDVNKDGFISKDEIVAAHKAGRR
jgi:Ca2+-binding EF-hand superfamily protein